MAIHASLLSPMWLVFARLNWRIPPPFARARTAEPSPIIEYRWYWSPVSRESADIPAFYWSVSSQAFRWVQGGSNGDLDPSELWQQSFRSTYYVKSPHPCFDLVAGTDFFEIGRSTRQLYALNAVKGQTVLPLVIMPVRYRYFELSLANYSSNYENFPLALSRWQITHLRVIWHCANMLQHKDVRGAARHSCQ
jgi:hypothetical protein